MSVSIALGVAMRMGWNGLFSSSPGPPMRPRLRSRCCLSTLSGWIFPISVSKLATTSIFTGARDHSHEQCPKRQRVIRFPQVEIGIKALYVARSRPMGHSTRKPFRVLWLPESQKANGKGRESDHFIVDSAVRRRRHQLT